MQLNYRRKIPFKQKVKRSLKFSLLLIRDIWHVFKYMLFVVFMLVIGWLAFTIPDQAKDIFQIFTNINLSSIRCCDPKVQIFFTFFASIWIWAIVIWYASRVFLHLVQVGLTIKRNRNFVKLLISWVPRVLGTVPFFIAFFALGNSSAKGALPMLLFSVSGLLFFTLTALRRLFKKGLLPVSPHQRKWRTLPKLTRIIIKGLLFLAAVIIIYFSIPYNPKAADWIGPAAVITIGLTVWTFFGIALMYIGYKLKLPVFLIVALIVYCFSSLNDNHEIRYIKPDKDEKVESQRVKDQVLDREHLERWLEKRKSEIGNENVDTFKVYIIAGEGGGIRAAYWTGAVLTKLIQLDPEFYHRTIAISTVSGSSVGAAFVNALYHDYALPQKQRNQQLNENTGDSLKVKLNKMLGEEDHLSGITSALIFPDLIQKFFPFKVCFWDRARWLEDSWSHAYKKHTKGTNLQKKGDLCGFETMDRSFLDLYANDTTFELPSLFLNTTAAETGQKAIISNLRLSTKGPEATKYFSDVIDFHSLVKKEIPLKTAASVSSRFPLITPAATVFDPVEEDPGAHFVDGGYFENTGLSTAMEILYMLNKVIDPNKVNERIGGKNIQNKIQPVIVFIKNGNYDADSIYFIEDSCKLHQGKAKPFRNMYETRVIVSTFLNVWDRGGLNTSKNVSQITNKLVPKVKMITIELERKETIPLGWYLSAEATGNMNKQIESPALKNALQSILL